MELPTIKEEAAIGEMLDEEAERESVRRGAGVCDAKLGEAQG